MGAPERLHNEERCANCGSKPRYLIPVWEDPDDYSRGKSADYVGCVNCNEMRSVDSETK